MSSGQQMPPWLQEQIGKLQQSQQSLQSIMAQKQQVEMDSAEADKALEELKKAGDDDQVFKHAGSILIKSTKNLILFSNRKTGQICIHCWSYWLRQIHCCWNHC